LQNNPEPKVFHGIRAKALIKYSVRRSDGPCFHCPQKAGLHTRTPHTRRLLPPSCLAVTKAQAFVSNFLEVTSYAGLCSNEKKACTHGFFLRPSTEHPSAIRRCSPYQPGQIASFCSDGGNAHETGATPVTPRNFEPRPPTKFEMSRLVSRTFGVNEKASRYGVDPTLSIDATKQKSNRQSIKIVFCILPIPYGVRILFRV